MVFVRSVCVSVTFVITCETLSWSSWSVVLTSSESALTNKSPTILNFHIDARILVIHIYDCFAHYVHFSLGYYHCYFMWQHSFDRLHDSFVDSLGSNGSQLLYGFLLRKLCTRKLFHSSCWMDYLLLCATHVPGKYHKRILFSQSGHFVGWFLVDNCLWYGRPLSSSCTRYLVPWG